MTTLKKQKVFCETCKQQGGTFICNGCFKAFCLDHSNEHRQSIDHQFNELAANHDRFQVNLTNTKSETYSEKLLQQVDNWQKQSINKINTSAERIRERLVSITRKHNDSIIAINRELIDRLADARKHQNYFEEDLIYLTNLFENLKNDFNRQKQIIIYEDKHENEFISNIVLADNSNDSIQQINNTPKSGGNIQKRDENSMQIRRIRFQIRNYEPKSKILMGAVSKAASHNTDPFSHPTFYGWGSIDLVYLHGVAHPNYNDYQSNFNQGDTFELILNFNEKKIQLTNERTGDINELDVDLKFCPLPWEPYVRIVNFIS